MVKIKMCSVCTEFYHAENDSENDETIITEVETWTCLNCTK